MDVRLRLQILQTVLKLTVTKKTLHIHIYLYVLFLLKLYRSCPVSYREKRIFIINTSEMFFYSI